jgi:O-antigen/teichoic acid export membrane protein
MINKLLRRIPVKELLGSTIAGNTGVMTAGIAIQILLQAAYFIVVTRTMGARSYGAFVAVSALCTLVAAFSVWGSDQLLIRTVANDRKAFARALGESLIWFAVTAPPFTVAAAIGFRFIVAADISWTTIALVACTEIIFARANYFAVNCFQAFERGRDMAMLGILLYATRVFAAVLWSATTTDPSPLSWAWFYAASSFVAGALSMIAVVVRLGRPVWRMRWHDWKDGGFFALQMGSFVGFRDIDKPVVVALAGLSQAGLYAAAFRIADVASVPVRALMYSTYVRFFQRGALGTRGSLDFARSLVPVGIVLGGLAGIGVAVASTFATVVIGENYHGVGPVLLLLSPLPLLYALYYIGADAMISGGHVGYRTLIQLALPAIDVGLCAVLVPRYGAAGAAMAATCTHIVLVAILWIFLHYLAREAPHAVAGQSSATVLPPTSQ